MINGFKLKYFSEYRKYRKRKEKRNSTNEKTAPERKSLHNKN